MLFCDADVTFWNRHVGSETVHALQLYKVVQPFETCAGLGPTGAVQRVDRGFGYCHAHGWEWRPRPAGPSKGGGRYRYASKPPAGAAADAFGTPWHPGFCMAMSMQTFEALGGLLEVAACGAGDHHMMAAFIGRADCSLPEGLHPNYEQAVLDFQRRAERVVMRHLGYVHGTIAHGFHAPLRNRMYTERWSILLEHQYDPREDLVRNACGVFEIRVDAKPRLHMALLAYFRARDEDAE